jgi:hypothetical protein
MMFTRTNILSLVGTTLLCVAAEASGELATNTASPNSFESFRIISERNIFNQNRGPRSARSDSAPTRPAPVIQALSLVGTMSFEKGAFAFFDGTRSDFKKPVKIGDLIAGYEVKEIKSDGVKIANETNEFEMKVGQQLRREDDAGWQLSNAPLPAPTVGSDSAAAAASSSDAPASVSEEEALKRLMEKRAKELNQ